MMQPLCYRCEERGREGGRERWTGCYQHGIRGCFMIFVSCGVTISSSICSEQLWSVHTHRDMAPVKVFSFFFSFLSHELNQEDKELRNLRLLHFQEELSQCFCLRRPFSRVYVCCFFLHMEIKKLYKHHKIRKIYDTLHLNRIRINLCCLHQETLLFVYCRCISIKCYSKSEKYFQMLWLWSVSILN